MTKKARITQKDLDAMKTLSEAGVKQNQICKVLDKGSSTVSRAKQADFNLDAYLEIVRDANARYGQEYRGERTGEKKVGGKMKPRLDHIEGQLLALLQNQVVMLETLSAIVDTIGVFEDIEKPEKKEGKKFFGR